MKSSSNNDTFSLMHWLSPLFFVVVSLEGRAVHLATLVQEAEQRVSELQAQVRSEGPDEREGSDQERQLKAWEWRLQLFRRMQTGFEHASKTAGHTLFQRSQQIIAAACCGLWFSFWRPFPSAGILSGLS